MMAQIRSKECTHWKRKKKGQRKIALMFKKKLKYLAYITCTGTLCKHTFAFFFYIVIQLLQVFFQKWALLSLSYLYIFVYIHIHIILLVNLGGCIIQKHRIKSQKIENSDFYFAAFVIQFLFKWQLVTFMCRQYVELVDVIKWVNILNENTCGKF